MVLRWSCFIALFLVSFTKAYAQNFPAVKFGKEKIQLIQNNNKKKLLIEVAKTPEQHAYGMMFREKLGPSEGMLFVFEDEQIRSFWMKNTLVNLDIAYINQKKVIIDIQQMKAVTSVMQTDLPAYPSKLPAMYALEMPEGWFKKNKFSEGAMFKFLTGPSSNRK